MTVESYFHVEDDTYCYPGTDVLCNLLGIRDGTQLSLVEAQIATAEMERLDEEPVVGCFDSDHLKEIHRRIFRRIYHWAGEFRTVEISKGIPFCYCANIERELNAVLGRLRDEDCLRGTQSRDEMARRLSYYMSELNAVHPFREGNGRAQRKFIQQIAS
ncbi:MAG: Fic family protein [Candidatus Methanomethylophilaceae archaeon]|nr:Fic family protein [Candidatus Methanomethylophilaceae archaeon]